MRISLSGLLIHVCALVVVAATPSAVAQEGAVPPPFDTITVDVSEGLARVLARDIEISHANALYLNGLIVRAGYLGTEADRSVLREIARRYSDRQTYGAGLVALRALATLGGEERFFIEVAQRWDPAMLPPGGHPMREPTFRMALASADFLAGTPTPRAVAVLDSLQKIENQFSFAYVNSLTNQGKQEAYEALPSDRARADEAVKLAQIGGGRDYISGHSSLMPLGWRWLRELSRSNPQALAAAIEAAAEAQRAESLAWHLDGVEDAGAGEREYAHREADRDALRLVRYVGALASPEVRALIDPTGETWTRSPYERFER